MNIELTDTQVHMLQALLYMTNLTLNPSDRAEFDSLYAALDVDGSISPFDADNANCGRGIELYRIF